MGAGSSVVNTPRQNEDHIYSEDPDFYFTLFDANRNGKVTVSELRKICRKLPNISMLDVEDWSNANMKKGYCSREDFCRMWNQRDNAGTLTRLASGLQLKGNGAIEIPVALDDFRELLERQGVEVDLWGIGRSKPIEALHDELRVGKSFIVSSGEGIRRVQHVAMVRIKRTTWVKQSPAQRGLSSSLSMIGAESSFDKLTLANSYQQYVDGRMRKNYGFLTEIVGSAETVLDAAHRGLQGLIREESKIEIEELRRGGLDNLISVQQSTSFPTLPVELHIHDVVAYIDGLPEYGFYSEPKESHDYIRGYYWEWVDESLIMQNYADAINQFERGDPRAEISRELGVAEVKKPAIPLKKWNGTMEEEGSDNRRRDIENVQLLHKFCENMDDVFVMPLVGGKSGSVVVRITAYSTRNRKQIAPLVLKFDRREKVEVENRRAKEIYSYMGNHAPNMVKDPLFGDLQGVYAMDMVGTHWYVADYIRNIQVSSFEDLVHSNQSIIMNRLEGRRAHGSIIMHPDSLVYEVFARILGPVHSKTRKKQTRNILDIFQIDECIERFIYCNSTSGRRTTDPATLKRLKRVGYDLVGYFEDFIEIKALKKHGIDTKDCIGHVKKFFEENVEYFNISYIETLVHGDLNGRNILADSQQHVWLIDFSAKTKRTSSLTDIAKLESSLMCEYATPWADDTQEECAMLLLHGLSKYGHNDSMYMNDLIFDLGEHTSPELVFNMKIIQTLRRAVRLYDGDFGDESDIANALPTSAFFNESKGAEEWSDRMALHYFVALVANYLNILSFKDMTFERHQFAAQAVVTYTEAIKEIILRNRQSNNYMRKFEVYGMPVKAQAKYSIEHDQLPHNWTALVRRFLHYKLVKYGAIVDRLSGESTDIFESKVVPLKFITPKTKLVNLVDALMPFYRTEIGRIPDRWKRTLNDVISHSGEVTRSFQRSETAKAKDLLLALKASKEMGGSAVNMMDQDVEDDGSWFATDETEIVKWALPAVGGEGEDSSPRRLLIVGNPGYGKSDVVQKINVMCAMSQPMNMSVRLSILIPCSLLANLVETRCEGNWSKSDLVLLYLEHILFYSEPELFNLCCMIWAGGEMARNSRLMFLFDDFDKVSQESRNEIVKYLHTQIHMHTPRCAGPKKCHLEESPHGVIVISRPFDIKYLAGMFRGYKWAVTTPLHGENLDVRARGELGRDTEDFALFLQNNAKLRDLAVYPILLDLIVHSFKVNMTNPVAILSRCVDVLLGVIDHTFDHSKNKPQSTMRRFVERLAFYVEVTANKVEFSEADGLHVAGVLDFWSDSGTLTEPKLGLSQHVWKELAKGVQDGKRPLIFCTPPSMGDLQYRFLHSTLREYLAAQCLYRAIIDEDVDKTETIFIRETFLDSTHNAKVFEWLILALLQDYDHFGRFVEFVIEHSASPQQAVMPLLKMTQVEHESYTGTLVGLDEIDLQSTLQAWEEKITDEYRKDSIKRFIKGNPALLPTARKRRVASSVTSIGTTKA